MTEETQPEQVQENCEEPKEYTENTYPDEEAERIAEEEETKAEEVEEEPQEPEVNTSYSFDNRRKLLTRVQTHEQVMGDTTHKRKQESVIGEKGIKDLWNFHNQQLKEVTGNIETIEKQLKDMPEMTEELIAFEKAEQERADKLALINRYNQAKQRGISQENLDSQLERKKQIEKEIHQIKDVIGTQLKL